MYALWCGSNGERLATPSTRVVLKLRKAVDLRGQRRCGVSVIAFSNAPGVAPGVRLMKVWSLRYEDRGRLVMAVEDSSFRTSAFSVWRAAPAPGGGALCDGSDLEREVETHNRIDGACDVFARHRLKLGAETVRL